MTHRGHDKKAKHKTKAHRHKTRRTKAAPRSVLPKAIHARPIVTTSARLHPLPVPSLPMPAPRMTAATAAGVRPAAVPVASRPVTPAVTMPPLLASKRPSTPSLPLSPRHGVFVCPDVPSNHAMVEKVRKIEKDFTRRKFARIYAPGRVWLEQGLAQLCLIRQMKSDMWSANLVNYDAELIGEPLIGLGAVLDLRVVSEDTFVLISDKQVVYLAAEGNKLVEISHEACPSHLNAQTIVCQSATGICLITHNAGLLHFWRPGHTAYQRYGLPIVSAVADWRGRFYLLYPTAVEVIDATTFTLIRRCELPSSYAVVAMTWLDELWLLCNKGSDVVLLRGLELEPVLTLPNADARLLVSNGIDLYLAVALFASTTVNEVNLGTAGKILVLRWQISSQRLASEVLELDNLDVLLSVRREDLWSVTGDGDHCQLARYSVDSVSAAIGIGSDGHSDAVFAGTRIDFGEAKYAGFAVAMRDADLIPITKHTLATHGPLLRRGVVLSANSALLLPQSE